MTPLIRRGLLALVVSLSLLATAPPAGASDPDSVNDVEVVPHDDAATLSWTTASPAAVYLSWGADRPLEGFTYVGYGSSHTATITGLECGTNYTVAAWHFSAGRNVEVRRTEVAGPACRFEVIDVAATSATKHSVLLQVETNEVSQLDVFVTAPDGSVTVVRSGHASPIHLVDLVRLECATHYEIWVTATGDGGAVDSSPSFEVLTLPCTNVEVSAPTLELSGVDVRVSWTSDVPSTGRLQIRGESTLVESSAWTSGGGLEHTALVSALECDTVYEAVTFNDTVNLTNQISRRYEFTTEPCVGFDRERPLRLMPIGDSITEGDGTTATYRRALWQLLQDEGLDVEFVGTRHGHQFLNDQFANFDQHHVAIAGGRSDSIRSMVDVAAPLLRPDVALIHVGTNDLLGGLEPSFTAQELEATVAALRAQNPSVLVIVSPLIGCDRCGFGPDRFAAFNDAIADAVLALDNDASRVLYAEDAALFDPTRHTSDGLHPNAAGDRVLADVWLETLRGPLGLDG